MNKIQKCLIQLSRGVITIRTGIRQPWYTLHIPLLISGKVPLGTVHTKFKLILSWHVT